MALIDVNWRPDQKQLRQFAAMFLVFFSVIAGVRYFVFEQSLLATQIMVSVAVVVGALGLMLPRLVGPVYVVMMAVALPIGMVLSTVMLSVIFYLIMTPIGLTMRMFGYDAMGRGFDPAARTYWIRHTAPERAGQYFKQF